MKVGSGIMGLCVEGFLPRKKALQISQFAQKRKFLRHITSPNKNV